MKPFMRITLVVAAAVLISGAAGVHFLGASRGGGVAKQANGDQKQGHDKQKSGEHSESERGVEMSDAKVVAAGIELVKAGPGELQESLQLNGVIQPNQEALVQVTPRFPGVVREMRKRLGDKVTRGEVLATVESNQSLTVFELRAPMDGTVIERQASLGEYVSEQKPVFVIADLSTVWIDFSVYKRDFGRVRLNDMVVIDAEDRGPAIDGKISYVSPLGASDTQSALARTVVANTGRLRTGLFVTGRLLLTRKPVPLAIKLSAVQSVEGRTVVFVRTGDRFEVRDVELGARDGEHAEILFGLLEGDVYAAKNSFVVKAELAKGSASHEH